MIADFLAPSCASSPGKNPAHLESARQLSTLLSDAGYKLIYGGGTMGIMGEVAKTFVANSGPGSVDGIIPRALIKTEKDPSTRNDSPSPNPDTKQAERIMSRAQLKRANTGDLIPQSEFGNTIVVRDMHTRKRMMAERVVQGGPGSGFVALAGGYGTIEEVMEMVTWNQIGIHKMPIVIVNVDGIWDGLLSWVRRSIEEGFVGAGNANILCEVKHPNQVLEALRSYKVAEGRFNLDWTNE